jgi:hypothetical protein
MPSGGNLNGPSKNRLAARASKAKKQRRTKSEQGRTKITHKDSARGARPGLLPTSGPRAKLSGKKARKLEKQMAHAMKRKMEAEGVVEMKGTWMSQDLSLDLHLSLNRSTLHHWAFWLLTWKVDAPELKAEEEAIPAEEMEIQ